MSQSRENLRTDGRTDGRTEGRKDGRTDGQADKPYFIELIRLRPVVHLAEFQKYWNPANIYLFKFVNRNTKKKVWYMFKVNNKSTRKTSLTSFIYFKHFLSVFIADFEKLNISWKLSLRQQSSANIEKITFYRTFYLAYSNFLLYYCNWTLLLSYSK